MMIIITFTITIIATIAIPIAIDQYHDHHWYYYFDLFPLLACFVTLLFGLVVCLFYQWTGKVTSGADHQEVARQNQQTALEQLAVLLSSNPRPG